MLHANSTNQALSTSSSLTDSIMTSIYSFLHQSIHKTFLHASAPSNLPFPSFPLFFLRCEVGTENWTQCNDHPIKICKYPVSGLFEGHSYHFRVRAVNSHGISKPSRMSDPIAALDPTEFERLHGGFIPYFVEKTKTKTLEMYPVDTDKDLLVKWKQLSSSLSADGHGLCDLSRSFITFIDRRPLERWTETECLSLCDPALPDKWASHIMTFCWKVSLSLQLTLDQYGMNKRTRRHQKRYKLSRHCSLHLCSSFFLSCGLRLTNYNSTKMIFWRQCPEYSVGICWSCFYLLVAKKVGGKLDVVSYYDELEGRNQIIITYICITTFTCVLWLVIWLFVFGCVAEEKPPGSPSGIHACETDRTYVVLSWKAPAYSSRAPMWYYIEKASIVLWPITSVPLLAFFPSFPSLQV